MGSLFTQFFQAMEKSLDLKLGVISGKDQFIAAAKEQREFKSLIAMISSLDYQGEVENRIGQLLSGRMSWRHTSPFDIPLAVYILALEELNRPRVRGFCTKMQRLDLYWAANVSRSILMKFREDEALSEGPPICPGCDGMQPDCSHCISGWSPPIQLADTTRMKSETIRSSALMLAPYLDGVESEQAEHVRWMLREVDRFVDLGHLAKAERWLCFAQGFVWTVGKVTIDELRSANTGSEPTD